ncbi:uncharacterized protein LOC115874533 isoform X2 [Sitophilus oryzae]|uniref:Uncharacterized protein LOC115874533 isoform X2 n=1 Tax=Sitophilus oryzae TaxID=7048 RepID=A0A6J2X2W7_SITOR|nr:uncharacterized protein LOC115874533 isoform X2 [Sitophilus oryzae]
MSGDIKKLLEEQRLLILEDRKRLGLLGSINGGTFKDLDELVKNTENTKSSVADEDLLENDKENQVDNRQVIKEKPEQFEKDIVINQKVPSTVGPLDWTRGYANPRDQEKRILIDALSNSEIPFSSRSDGAYGYGAAGSGSPFGAPVLRRGEFAPQYHARLRAAPHAGLGEYDLASVIYRDRRREDYRRHLAEVQCEPGTLSCRRTVTDELVDAALRKGPLHVDQRLTTEQNDLVVKAMDKPKSILSNRRTGSPRDGYNSDLSHSAYVPGSFMDGFSYSDRAEELERERMKREAYQRELRLQIEEKRRLQSMRDEQERRERELENRRLEQQLLRMQEEQAVEEQRRQHRSELFRRHSDDLLRRKTELHELQRPWRRHADSESVHLDGLGAGAHYSPPVARRTLPYSSFSLSDPSRYNSSTYCNVYRKEPTYDTVPLRHQRRFDRFDSLSRIDSLSHRLETMSVRDGPLTTADALLGDCQRRHSATQQDLRKSPRLSRRNSASRFEEAALPQPTLLKARSPVAKDLRNAVPFSSAQQLRRSGGGGVLGQLGSIRTQLQREQLRMDENLRRRGLARTRTTDDY